MLRPPEGSSAPLCECGCGQTTNWLVAKARWGTFLRGHCHRGRTSALKGVPISTEHKASISVGMLQRKAAREGAPLCECGCGGEVRYAPGVGWRRFLAGHGAARVGPVTAKEGTPPLCACGCKNPVTWRPGVGWSRYVVGHVNKGKKFSTEHKRRQSEGAIARNMLVRMHAGTVGVAVQNIYGTRSYKEQRKLLVEGKPCAKCGSLDRIHAHHQVAGDNTSLIPLCSACHAQTHHGVAIIGTHPPVGETPPLCACGCKTPVRWRAYVGWREYAGAGHYNTSGLPTGTASQEPPKCKCGCGEPTSFRYGRGWRDFRPGHQQRVMGTSFRIQAQRDAAAK